ncbi:MAG: hypothetical protein IBX57_01025 [Gammaproteobacteria bacterium]|nr:hypothetical protein [Gammaproteobacteria bacterium]
MFLTTLFMEISKVSPKHEEILEQLNKELKIVDDVRSFGVPISLYKVIWGNKHINTDNIDCTQKEQQLNGIYSRVVKELADWSHYSNDEQVKQEVRLVIMAGMKARQQLAAA